MRSRKVILKVKGFNKFDLESGSYVILKLKTFIAEM